MLEEYSSIINTFITAFASIAIAIIGVFDIRKAKKDEADKKLREENEKLQEEKRKREKEEQLEETRELKRMLAELTNEVTQLREDYDMSKIEKQLNKLHFLNEFNLEFIQSLSSVVLIMGDTISASSIVDDDTRNTLRQELSRHKKSEQEITQKLVKIIA